MRKLFEKRAKKRKKNYRKKTGKVLALSLTLSLILHLLVPLNLRRNNLAGRAWASLGGSSFFSNDSLQCLCSGLRTGYENLVQIVKLLV
jgi:hypothetical protein